MIIKECITDAAIQHAEDYDEVYAQLHNEPYDLILLDINMPGGNNVNVIQEILNIQSQIKILVFSSYDESIYALRYINAGACGYLNKSTAMSELKKAIESIMTRGKYMSDAVNDLYLQKLTMGKSALDQNNPLHRLSNRE